MTFDVLAFVLVSCFQIVDHQYTHVCVPLTMKMGSWEKDIQGRCSDYFQTFAVP